MQAEDNGTEMSEMRSDMDTVQSDPTESMSEMQESDMVYTEEIQDPQKVKWRVRLLDYQQIGTPILYLEYFDNYGYALERYNELCEDKQFIKHHKDDVIAELETAHRGWAEIFWETVMSSVIYNDAE